MSDEEVQLLQAAVFAGRKIEAIKIYRRITGRGLKESKDFVEALEAELRQSSPELFTAPPGRKGCAVFAAVLAVLIGIAASVLR